jgi:carboxyl-terminal processing protease
MMFNKFNSKHYLFPLFIASILTIGILTGYYLHKPAAAPNYFVYSGKDKLSEVFDYIKKLYVDTVDNARLEDAAIVAMLDSLDPHSLYVPAEELKQMNEPLEGKFSGIGVQFSLQNDTIVVVKTILNGPSEKIGILAGDRIIKINDTLYAGQSITNDVVMKKLKGKKGSKVKVGILRQGVAGLIDFVITRDEIPLNSVDVAYMLNDHTGLIKISEFSRRTAEEFVNASKGLIKKGMTKLIIDLRDNGGGFLNAALEIADEILSDGKLIVYTEGKASPRRDVYATRKGSLENTEIVILINEWSASASEIVAGAVQDNDRGIIIGRRSFGKGLVQQQLDLSDGSALRLTIARYYTPSGRSIQKPYTSADKDDYFHDLVKRYEHGEFFEVDSIQFSDSLKYFTTSGRVVYGGGGIMPDIFVPHDTMDISTYYSMVVNKGLVYKFAFNYADKNRPELYKYKTVNTLENYLDSKNLLHEFVLFAEKEGIERNDTGINKSKTLLITLIKANVARNVLDNEGFYPIIGRIDATLKKAMETKFSQK